MTREEHMQWCKDRAMQYVNSGDVNQGLTSMMSDLSKHPETKNHPGIQIGVMLMMTGKLADRNEAERFINGFN